MTDRQYNLINALLCLEKKYEVGKGLRERAGCSPEMVDNIYSGFVEAKRDVLRLRKRLEFALELLKKQDTANTPTEPREGAQ